MNPRKKIGDELVQELEKTTALLRQEVAVRARAEEAIRLSEERFRALVQNLSDAIVIMEPDGKRRYVSAAAHQILGYAPEEMVGRSVFEDLHPEDVERARAVFERCVRTPHRREVLELRARNRDGSWRSIECTCQNLLDNPAIRGIVINSRDITERKRTEEALQEERDFSMSLIQASPAFFIAVDPDGRIRLMNDSMLQAFGYKLEEVVGEFTIAVLISPHAYEVSLDFFDRLVKAREPVQREVWMVAKDGRELLVEWQGRSVVRPGGDLDFVFAVGVDVTERRKREEEAIQAQKMESIGVLAGGIAHDFNNILGAIVLNISLAEMEPRWAGDRYYSLLADAKKASLRARGITQQLLTFSKGGLPVKKTVCILDTIRDSTGLALTGSRSRCVFELPEALWPVEADEGQIGQVISNLVINADQAMPEGGTILVTAENLTIENQAEAVRLKPGNHVKISVRDEGVGIAAEHLPKIFDPYFSTKHEGSGLGLAISYSIVDKHGGVIRVETKPGVETVFSVFLPASEKALPAAAVPEKETAPRSGSVLVVDDDEMLRTAVSRALEKMGYRAVSCEDGAQAIDLYRKAREKGEPFDVVLMDLTIPGGMDGREAMRRLVQIDPRIRAIVCSGYSNDPILSNYRESGFCGVIAKPYGFEELAQTLRSVMAGRDDPVRPERPGEKW